MRASPEMKATIVPTSDQAKRRDGCESTALDRIIDNPSLQLERSQFHKEYGDRER